MFKYMYVRCRRTKYEWVYYCDDKKFDDIYVDSPTDYLDVINYYGGFGWEFVNFDKDKILLKFDYKIY